MQEIANIVINGWNWDLSTFATHMHLPPTANSTIEQFVEFQKAADALRRLSPETLKVVTGKSNRTPAEA